MKPLCQSIVLLLSITINNSCKKEKTETGPLGSLMIVNVVPGGKSVKLGSNASLVANNSAAYFTLNANSQNIYVWPDGDSLHPYYNSNKNLEVVVGDVYSLYLAGSATVPEGLLVKENIPYRTDSTTGIRFINLSTTGPAINVTLSTTPSINEISALTYKQITEFKTYSARFNNTYTFQFRDANTNAILSTMAFTTTTIPRFSNITLVIRGVPGSIGITRINNDR
jgi:hypothetical protein